MLVHGQSWTNRQVILLLEVCLESVLSNFTHWILKRQFFLFLKICAVSTVCDTVHKYTDGQLQPPPSVQDLQGWQTHGGQNCEVPTHHAHGQNTKLRSKLSTHNNPILSSSQLLTTQKKRKKEKKRPFVRAFSKTAWDKTLSPRGNNLTSQLGEKVLSLSTILKRFWKYKLKHHFQCNFDTCTAGPLKTPAKY